MAKAGWLIIAVAIVAAPALAAQRTVIHNVSLVTMLHPEPVTGQIVIVAKDRIVGLIDKGDFESRPGDRLLDGEGGFLLPGLIDAHIHIDHPQDLQAMALYGVTSAVNMRGLPSHLKLRSAIRSQGLFAPDFVTAGDYIDGNPPSMLPMASVAGTDAAAETVSLQHAAGFDFIKVYSELSLDQYRAICARAAELGMAVTGHLPDAIELKDLLACPHRNVAHGEQLFKVLASRSDRQEIAGLLRALADHDLTVTTNVALLAASRLMPDQLDALLARPETQLLHPVTFQPWRPGFNRYARRGADWVERVRLVVADLNTIIEISRETPGVLVAGTDMPVAAAFPGVSLIEELQAHQAAGLTPFEALQLATVHAGRLLRQLQPAFPQTGVIQAGARADLVLVEENPLADLATLRMPRAVMLRGVWHDQSALSRQRQTLVSANSRRSVPLMALEKALFSGDLEQARTLFDAARADRPDAKLFAQYPLFFFGFQWLYGANGLTDNAEDAARAVQVYDIYRQTYSEFQSAHHVYGLALEAAGEFTTALAAQEAALRILPTYWPALEARARLVEQLAQ